MKWILVLTFSAILWAVSCRQPATRSVATKGSVRPAKISAEEAVMIASKECEAKGIDVSKSKPKTELKANLWIVTFPENLAAGVRGPDYLAKLHVNADTGKVEKVLIGSYFKLDNYN